MKKLYKYSENRFNGMQKVLTTLLLSITFCFATQAQNYKITFSCAGESTTVDSIRITNVTQETSISLLGTETLHLVQNITGINDLAANEDFIAVYPNPMTQNAKLEFVCTQSGVVMVRIFDLAGKIVAANNQSLKAGKSIYQISGIKSGTYLVKIQLPNKELSTKLISINGSNGIPQIHQLSTNSVTNLKSAASEERIEMQYNEGDSLLFIGYSGIEYVDSIGYVFTDDTNIEFNFEAQITTYEFEIFVRDVDSWSPINQQGDLVIGATVKLLDINNPDKAIPLYEGMTDSIGKLVLNNVLEGNYLVYVEKNNQSNIVKREVVDNKVVGFVVVAIFQNEAETQMSAQPNAIVGGPKYADINNDKIYNVADKKPGDNVSINSSISKTYYISKFKE